MDPRARYDLVIVQGQTLRRTFGFQVNKVPVVWPADIGFRVQFRNRPEKEPGSEAYATLTTSPASGLTVVSLSPATLSMVVDTNVTDTFPAGRGVWDLVQVNSDGTIDNTMLWGLVLTLGNVTKVRP